jgi:mono/diheme cytochrome c family protein
MRTFRSKQLVLLLVAVLMLAGVASTAMAQQDNEAASTPIPLRGVPSQNPAALVEAEGAETLQANCLACHTAQPILTHDGFTPEVWQAEVDKMRQTYGAEITDEDAEIIVAYLSEHYSDEPVSPDDFLLMGLNAEVDDAGVDPAATPGATPNPDPSE